MTAPKLSGMVVLALLTLTVFLGLAAVRPAAAVSCTVGSYCGTVYVSTVFNGVDDIPFTYVQGTQTLTWGTDSILASHLQGGQSDGLIFDTVTKDLMVGVNCFGPASIVEISPTTGAVLSTISTGGVSPSHLMADQQGNAWASDDGCPTDSPAVQIPLPASSPTVTTHAITGSTNFVNTLIVTSSKTTAFYTSTPCCGGGGQFGTINLSTFVTTCATVVTGGCASFPAAHGGTFDPYTGDVMIFGNDHITQIDPTTLAVVSDLVVPGAGFDQGTVDGSGHLFVAGGPGVFFLDYRTSGLVSSAGNYMAASICNPSCTGGGADDVAPLVGPGSPVNGVPEFPFGPFAVFALAVPILLVLKARHSGSLRASPAP